MRISSYILAILFVLLSSCAKYSDKKVEGVWLLEKINLCLKDDTCFDTLEDRGTRDKYDKIELKLTRGRDATARFYKTGILLFSFEFEYLLDEKEGRMSFLGPNDVDFQNFFGTNVEILDLNKSELVYQAIEDYPDESTVYIYKRLQ